MRRKQSSAFVWSRRAAGAAAMALVLTAATTTRGQNTAASQLPPLLPTSMVGSVSFDLYCSSCHGRDGKGDGPVAPALRSAPADLTTLARRNGGQFPRAQVLSFIDGKGRVPAHGPSDMPVWGPTFRALEESGGRVTVRLDHLVAYLESIQVGPEPPAAAAPSRGPDGAALFAAYCASCHGPDGRGGGPLATQLRHEPPDLTGYAAANRGVFPTDRLAQIIDGRPVAAHGSRDMPVWGDAFRRDARGGGDAGARARIAALLTFLEGIQRRAAE